jgi:hypothetical protein
VTCTDGGWIPESAQYPETTTDVPVGAVRVFDVLADNPGDWAFHCHKSHHTMGPMGHRIPNMIGVDQAEVAEKIGRLMPDYMAMGEMEMPAPDNTLPMMSGAGQFGPIEMGGMFTTVKIREGMAPNDYSDPGPYKHPPGTVAFEFKGETAQPPRQTGPAQSPAPATVKKPAAGGHSSH